MMKNRLHMVSLYVIIANYGQANSIIRYAKQLGVTGATVCYGTGTVKLSKLLEFFDLATIKKEIIFMIAETRVGMSALELITNKFHFDKPNKGIAFAIPITNVIGSRLFPEETLDRGDEQTMYQAIFTIVDKGQAEEVIESAKQAGSRGGTIINARGSGIHETAKFFNMEVLPEKEIVLILCEKTITHQIIDKIRETLDIDQASNGIIFVQEVSETFGLQKGKNI